MSPVTIISYEKFSDRRNAWRKKVIKTGSLRIQAVERLCEKLKEDQGNSVRNITYRTLWGK
jgi:hypothetical protein